jgi:hypothetical protein
MSILQGTVMCSIIEVSQGTVLCPVIEERDRRRFYVYITGNGYVFYY